LTSSFSVALSINEVAICKAVIVSDDEISAIALSRCASVMVCLLT